MLHAEEHDLEKQSNTSKVLIKTALISDDTVFSNLYSVK